MSAIKDGITSSATLLKLGGIFTASLLLGVGFTSYSLYKNWNFPQIPKPQVKGINIIVSPTVSTTPTIAKKPSQKHTPTPTKIPNIDGKQSQSTENKSNQNTSSSESNTTKTQSQVTPAPTQVPTVSFSTDNVSITMNKGETKNDIVIFTAFTDLTFETKMTLNPAIQGLNFGPASGAIGKDQTSSLHMTIPSNTPSGLYNGSITYTFSPGNVTKTVNLSITIQDPPASSFGFTINPESMSVTVKKGESVNVFSFTSISSNQYNFIGTPGPGLNFRFFSGGISPGQTKQQIIDAMWNVPTGTYNNAVKMKDTQSGAEKDISLTVNVID